MLLDEKQKELNLGSSTYTTSLVSILLNKFVFVVSQLCNSQQHLHTKNRSDVYYRPFIRVCVRQRVFSKNVYTR